MATFRKYKWNTKAEFEAFFTLSQPDATCVELGHIEQTPAVVSGDVEISPAVVSAEYCVDLLWNDQPAPDWEQYETWPEPVGVHTFLGWDEQYTNEYNERLPE